METRRIMKLGRSSLVVSLPKRWVELNHLKQGDVITITTQRDGSLAIFPGVVKRDRKKEITIKIEADENPDFIVRKIVSSYLNGCSDIYLASSGVLSVAQQKAIRDISGKLFLQIMEADSKRMHIQSLLDESRVSVESGIRRMYVLTSSMCQDVLKALETWDTKLAKSVYALDDNVDQFFFMLLRLLRMAMLDLSLANKMGLEPLNCLDYEAVVRKIEHIGDHVANIAARIILIDGAGRRFDQETISAMLKIGAEAHRAYEKAFMAFVSKDAELANQAIELRTHISKLCDRMAEKIKEQKDNIIVCGTCSIRDSIMRIAEFTAGIAEIAMDHAITPKP